MKLSKPKLSLETLISSLIHRNSKAALLGKAIPKKANLVPNLAADTKSEVKAMLISQITYKVRVLLQLLQTSSR